MQGVGYSSRKNSVNGKGGVALLDFGVIADIFSGDLHFDWISHRYCIPF